MRDTSQTAWWNLSAQKTPILMHRKIGEQHLEGIINLSDMHGLLLLWAIDILPVKACHLWHHQPLCFNFVSLYVGGTLLGCVAQLWIRRPLFLSLFFFFFSAGFAQGHDTFLRGFGSPSLIIPSIIQWLAGRWSEAMNKANLWAHELWQYKHTISTHFLCSSLKMHHGILKMERC